MSNQWLSNNIITASHLFITISIFGSALLYVNSMDKRISVLETHITQVEQRIDRQESYIQRSIDDLKDSVIRLEDKLDTYIFQTN
jgi:hypothetical protein